MKILFFLLLSLQFSHALIISPEDALKQTLLADDVSKQSKILTKAQHKQVQQLAKTKLKSKLYRIYHATKNAKTIGHGILLTHSVRSKNTAVLSIIDTKGTLIAIEIIAFNEPKEYLPSKRWLQQFDHNQAEHFNTQSGNINNITGATLSASAVVNIANLAHAIAKVTLKP